MKFSAERAVLVKMLKLTGGKPRNQRGREKLVRLSVCAGRVFVETSEMTGGMEAQVQENGTCLLVHEVFLKLLKTYSPKARITIEADERALKFGSTTLRVSEYSRAVTPPAKFQVFPVSGRRVLPPDPQPSETGAGEPPAQSTPIEVPESEATLNRLAVHEAAEDRPQFFTSVAAAEAWFNLPEGEFYSIPDDEEFFEHVIGCVRRICALPQIKPQELVGLARALYALERLPRISPGVAVECSVGVRWGTETEYSESVVSFRISEEEFRAERMEMTYDPDVGGDHHSTIVFEISRYSHREPEYEGDSGGWMKVLDWMSFVDEHLAGNKTNLILKVDDESKPDSMG